MNGEEFEVAVRRHVAPVLEPLGFRLCIRTSGRLYSAEFESPRNVVSISFEPGDDYFLVIVFTVTNGGRSHIDDRRTSPRLADLNARFLTKRDGAALDEIRLAVTAADPVERRIQRTAAELAIVLPRYLRSSAHT